MKKVILLIVLLTSGFLVEGKLNRQLNSNMEEIQIEANRLSKESLSSTVSIEDTTK